MAKSLHPMAKRREAEPKCQLQTFHIGASVSIVLLVFDGYTIEKMELVLLLDRRSSPSNGVLRFCSCFDGNGSSPTKTRAASIIAAAHHHDKSLKIVNSLIIIKLCIQRWVALVYSFDRKFAASKQHHGSPTHLFVQRCYCGFLFPQVFGAVESVWRAGALAIFLIYAGDGRSERSELAAGEASSSVKRNS